MMRPRVSDPARPPKDLTEDDVVLIMIALRRYKATPEGAREFYSFDGPHTDEEIDACARKFWSK